MTEFPIPAGSSPWGIAFGSDGALWFVENKTNRIGRMTTSGALTEFPIPTADSDSLFIAAGADGNLWFTEWAAGKIGRITTAGVITEFSVPSPSGTPKGITAGPDGNIWFTEWQPNKIGRITPSGLITEFPTVPTTGNPFEIATGPDGNLWFTDYFSSKIGRISTAGVVSEFPIPHPNSNPYGITAGPDGNVWFTEYEGNQIGRITTSSATGCTADAHTLCLNAGRFAVSADFQQTPEGPSSPATAVPLTSDTGYFWFFDPANIELVVKVLDGCPVNQRHWVFAGGLTNVGVELKVIDTLTGDVQNYSNAVGTAFQPIQDSSAFLCP